MVKEAIGVKGEFSLKIYIDNKLIESYVDNNLVVNIGKENVAKLLGGAGFAVTKIQAGTSTVPPAVGDTAITNAFTKNISSVIYPSSNEVEFDWILTSTEANGMTISEFGLIDANNILFARKTRTPIQKVSPMVIVGAWKITIN